MISLKKLFSTKILFKAAMFIFGLVVMYTIFQLLLSFREGVKIKAKPSDKSLPMSIWNLKWNKDDKKFQWIWKKWGGERAAKKGKEFEDEDGNFSKTIDWQGDLKPGKNAGGMIIAGSWWKNKKDEIREYKNLVKQHGKAKKAKKKAFDWIWNKTKKGLTCPTIKTSRGGGVPGNLFVEEGSHSRWNKKKKMDVDHPICRKIKKDDIEGQEWGYKSYCQTNKCYTSRKKFRNQKGKKYKDDKGQDIMFCSKKCLGKFEEK